MLLSQTHRLILISTVFLLLVSCGTKPGYQKRFNRVIGEYTFRNVNLGASYNTILNNEESAFLVFPDSNLLKYIYHVSDSEEYHWVYIFNDESLTRVQFDAYLGQESQGDHYSTLIAQHYEKKFNPPVSNNGVFQWRTDSLYIDLINESPEALMGKVKLFFYLPEDTLTHSNVP